MSVTVYVEGGGENEALLTRCKQAFSSLLKKAGLQGRMPKIVACGSRNQTYKQFVKAIQNKDPDETVMLLVDSESAVTSRVWQHLQSSDKWKKPAGASDKDAHLMVQCMETWLIADREALQAFYGHGFKADKLPAHDLESIAKDRLFDAFKAATKDTKTKGPYNKSSHSFKILALVDPAKIRQASPHAERFFTTLTTLTQS